MRRQRTPRPATAAPGGRGGDEPPPPDLAAGYAAMAADEAREREAHEWAEGLVGDIADDEPIRHGPASAVTCRRGGRVVP